jgi:hypothetical protein
MLIRIRKFLLPSGCLLVTTSNNSNISQFIKSNYNNLKSEDLHINKSNIKLMK